jgi:precorrin-6B methylase 2
MTPLILQTKYAFHALLWLLDPDVILDVGSMDGSDSKKFKRLTQNAEVVAFEANPDNYRLKD